MSVHALEEFEDTKGAIRIGTSKKDRQHNAQTTIYKTLRRKQKIEQHETPLKTGDELRCSGRFSSSYSTSDIRRALM
jgi:hypothetical protein